MRKMKRIISLLVALVMVFSMSISVFADTNNVVPDTSISVSGLEAGDKVNFTQVIKWVEGSGWAYVDGLQAAAQSASVVLPALTTITGTTGNPGTTGTISAEHAAILAKAAAKLPAASVHSEDANSSTKTATYNNAPAGLYYAQVVPRTADYLYNTIFVGADFKSDNTTNTIAADTATLAASANANAMAKKERITVDKETQGSTDNLKYDHNVGDVVNFTITSKVPAYGAGYIDPNYEITDTVEENLALCNSSGGAASANDISVTIDGVNLAAGDVTVALTGTTGFTVTVNKSGLDKVAAIGDAKQITVSYKAKITSVENATVTEKTNEATVKFSNKPTDKNSYSLVEDKTRHYTFSLDANLLGYTGENYITDEIIKVGLDENGHVLSETKKYHSGTTWTEQSPLQGAKFALFKESPAAADYASENAARNSSKLYTNSGFNGIVTSDPNGRLNITGLDASTYYLREVKAPTGYIMDNRTFTITINATYTEVPSGSYTNNQGIKVNYNSYKVLNNYTVEVSDGTATTTSSYNITNAGPVQSKKVDKVTYQTITGNNGGDFAGDVITPISNTQGTPLPSTGGIGTTIFYVLGFILVIGAGVVLVSRRRMRLN